MEKAQWVWVVNNSGKPHGDRFDSVDYEFAPNEPVELPVEAAQLLFGYGKEDKADTIRRLGWALTASELPAAKERLQHFSFHVERPDPVRPKEMEIPTLGKLSLKKEDRPSA